MAMQHAVTLRDMMKIVRHPDSRLIDSLGGPAQLARLLGMTKPGSVQRIVNWRRRGIPYRVKVENAQIFVTAMLKDQSLNKATACASQTAPMRWCWRSAWLRCGLRGSCRTGRFQACQSLSCAAPSNACRRGICGRRRRTCQTPGGDVEIWPSRAALSAADDALRRGGDDAKL